MKNRMRESRSFGSVRGEGSNVLAYSENLSCTSMHFQALSCNAHNAGVEGSSPSLSTNYLTLIRQFFRAEDRAAN